MLKEELSKIENFIKSREKEFKIAKTGLLNKL